MRLDNDLSWKYLHRSCHKPTKFSQVTEVKLQRQTKQEPKTVCKLNMGSVTWINPIWL